MDTRLSEFQLDNMLHRCFCDSDAFNPNTAHFDLDMADFSCNAFLSEYISTFTKQAEGMGGANDSAMIMTTVIYLTQHCTF